MQMAWLVGVQRDAGLPQWFQNKTQPTTTAHQGRVSWLLPTDLIDETKVYSNPSPIFTPVHGLL